MSITLEEFYANISNELKRGTSLDAQIPGRVRRAVRMMEDIHTFRYMEHFASLDIDASQTEPRAYATPSGLKSVYFWRILKTTGGYRYLKKVDPRDVDSTEEAMPKAYWQDGMDYFWLDNTPVENYETEMAYVAYTDIDWTDLSLTPHVVANFESVIQAQACMLFAPQMRDYQFIEAQKEIRNDAMKSAVDADVEGRQSNESPAVRYGWEFAEEINDGD